MSRPVAAVFLSEDDGWWHINIASLDRPESRFVIDVDDLDAGMEWVSRYLHNWSYDRT
jgi:hypothetical protein